MADYVTKEYYEEKVVEAGTRVELLCYALVHKIKSAEIEPKASQLYNACKVLVDACDEADKAKEKYNAYCSDERGAEESAEV